MNKNKETKRKYVVLLLLLLLLAICLILYMLWPSVDSPKTDSAKKKITLPDTIPAMVKRQKDTVLLIDSVTKPIKKDTLHVVCPVKKHKISNDSVRIAPVCDTLKKDTVVSHTDTVSTDTVKKVIVDPCSADTSSLWVYPDPSGGLHRSQPQILFFSNRACSIQWKFESQSDWKTYTGSPIAITATSTLQYKAIDSCGKQMEIRSEYYEIERAESIKYCPDGMEYIKVANERFCIDRYEWPNRKDAMPLSYITKYGASDSCFSVGKRLCNVDEWTLACTGPYGWKYPYGQLYERYACSTHDTAAVKSGSKVECRSFFGVYDMAGDLAEWTDTRATENRNFYYVKGGFWESGPQSSCYEKRYSYYPQNRHNPVGFRCCQDVLVPDDRKNK